MYKQVGNLKTDDRNLVATHDIHYIEPEDAHNLNILKKLNGGKIITGPFYFPSPEEMKEKFHENETNHPLVLTGK